MNEGTVFTTCVVFLFLCSTILVSSCGYQEYLLNKQRIEKGLCQGVSGNVYVWTPCVKEIK